MNKDFEPLFKSGSDYHNNACLNFMHDMSHGYIDGYKMAADELAKKINATGANQDYLVYPIVFLYRQHLELILKNIIKTARHLLGKSEQGYPTHHRIKDLWPLVKELRKKIWNEHHPAEFKFIDHIITEYSKYDPYSMAFRFSEDKKGVKPNQEVRHINTRHLANYIDKASDILWGIQYGIDYLSEHQNS